MVQQDNLLLRCLRKKLKAMQTAMFSKPHLFTTMPLLPIVSFPFQPTSKSAVFAPTWELGRPAHRHALASFAPVPDRHQVSLHQLRETSIGDEGGGKMEQGQIGKGGRWGRAGLWVACPKVGPASGT